MHSYSGKTRVSLTATGWLSIAQEALAQIKQSSNRKKSAGLRDKVKTSIRMAIINIDQELSYK
jgi:hypothetical protein